MFCTKVGKCRKNLKKGVDNKDFGWYYKQASSRKQLKTLKNNLKNIKKGVDKRKHL